MKKIAFFVCVAMALTSCEKQIDTEKEKETGGKQLVTITFTPYDMEVMAPTRTATSVADYCTHIDIWLSTGTSTNAYHQLADQTGFGTMSLPLDKTKTYTLTAVAHRCDGNATLTDGVIAFPGDKLTQSMVYTTTFSPATTTNINAEMQRIVAQFRLEVTDNIPDDVKKLRFTISDIFDRWNVTTGGTHSLDRVSTINYNGTSSIFNIYAIVTDAETTHTVTVEALGADDDVIVTRSFANVPLINGYRSTYRGNMFSETNVIMGFVSNDWNAYDVVNF